MNARSNFMWQITLLMWYDRHGDRVSFCRSFFATNILRDSVDFVYPSSITSIVNLQRTDEGVKVSLTLLQCERVSVKEEAKLYITIFRLSLTNSEIPRLTAGTQG